VIRIEFSNIQTPEIVAEYGPGQSTDFSIRVLAGSLLEQERGERWNLVGKTHSQQCDIGKEAVLRRSFAHVLSLGGQVGASRDRTMM